MAGRGLGGGPKPAKKRPHLLSGRFRRMFYKKTIFPRRPLLIGPKSGRQVKELSLILNHY